MEIDDLIDTLQDWKSKGIKYVEKNGSSWYASKWKEAYDPYDDIYLVNVTHPEADWNNHYNWKAGKDFVEFECKIDELRILSRSESSYNHMIISVNLKPVDPLPEIPDWYKQEEYRDYFLDWDISELVQKYPGAKSCSI
jgi:hypothetical protein